MNIYKVSQTGNDDYDAFDSMIVIAKTEEDARWIRPDETSWDRYFCKSAYWATMSWWWPEELTVEYLGIYHPEYYNKAHVVLASF